MTKPVKNQKDEKNNMQLKIFSPTGIVLDTEISKITFESIDGFWTLLPRHADTVSALTTGILTYQLGNKLSYAACYNGVLVKKNETVSVSTKLAVLGDNLDQLKQTIALDFKTMEQERKEINLTMARLEIGLTKGLMALKQEQGGHL